MVKYQRTLSTAFSAEVGTKRKGKNVTQAELAQLAGVSIPTIRQFENARGQIGTATRIVAALGFVWGWSISATDEPGRSLAALRMKAGLSQRVIAQTIQVSQPTIVSIETRFCGSLPVLLAYLAAIGCKTVLRDPKIQGRVLVPQRNAPEADIVMTTSSLARRVIAAFASEMNGVVLEPARGEGAFFNQLPRHVEPDWCEISMGRDFFGYSRKVDWIITNPPFSLFKEFLFHALDVAENIVFLCPLNHFGTKHRLRRVGAEGFGFKRVILTPQPKEWTSTGFQIAAVHLQRGWEGQCAFETL